MSNKLLAQRIDDWREKRSPKQSDGAGYHDGWHSGLTELVAVLDTVYPEGNQPTITRDKLRKGIDEYVKQHELHGVPPPDSPEDEGVEWDHANNRYWALAAMQDHILNELLPEG